MKSAKYKIRVVRGAFINSGVLNKLGAKKIEDAEDDNWQSIDELVVDLKQVKELQNNMIKHYQNTTDPWYMDGYNTKDKNEIIVAFGADDGEGGKIFKFKRGNNEAIKRVVNYGISKGIPTKEMDFSDTWF